jgi:hypothetical protein
MRVLLQVSESCGFVFLDGTETSGSATASIIVKYGRHARFLHFHVWSPELPLDVELSDIRLGRVVGWAVPQIATNATSVAGSRFLFSFFFHDGQSRNFFALMEDRIKMQKCGVV